jgi:hypothetical protein
MKYAKALAIAALAAMAVMAVVASSASASKICTNDEKHASTTSCGSPHGFLAKTETPIDASLVAGTSALLTVTNNSGTTVRDVTCTTSTVSGKVTNASTGTGDITGLTFSNCSSSGCTNVTASAPRTGKSFPWAVTTTTTTAPNGTMTVSGVSGKFTATCSFITATCEFEAASATTTVKGGAPATVEAKQVPLNLVSGSEFICGTKADWNGTYTITTPSSFYLT